MKTRWPFRLFIIGLILAFAAVAAFSLWAFTPIRMRTAQLDFSVKPGNTARTAALQIRAQGADLSPRLFYWLARLSGQGTQLKAGSYEIEQGTSPWQLLQKMARGDQSLLAITVPEGWTFQQFRQALNNAPGLDHDAQNLSTTQIMQSIGAPEGTSPEGWFFPDTYLYASGSSELTIFKRAYHAMQRQLDAAWSGRQPGLPLQNPYQALILASMVEKETGKPSDRDKIAAVFINRLRNGMPLQSDPTVIYAMGDRYKGVITRKDLQIESPYNTYLHAGLPPTPIALPGDAALHSVLHPASTRALYFVARGDGSSAFSDTLAEHNAAVNRYILKRSP